MNFEYITNTECLIDGKVETIRLGNGCSGIGSRQFWVNNCLQDKNIILLSEDITNGNHFIYFGYWGKRPWDTVYYLVNEAKKEWFLKQFDKNNVYGKAIKMKVRRGDLIREIQNETTD